MDSTLREKGYFTTAVEKNLNYLRKNKWKEDIEHSETCDVTFLVSPLPPDIMLLDFVLLSTNTVLSERKEIIRKVSDTEGAIYFTFWPHKCTKDGCSQWIHETYNNVHFEVRWNDKVLITTEPFHIVSKPKCKASKASKKETLNISISKLSSSTTELTDNNNASYDGLPNFPDSVVSPIPTTSKKRKREKRSTRNSQPKTPPSNSFILQSGSLRESNSVAQKDPVDDFMIDYLAESDPIITPVQAPLSLLVPALENRKKQV